MRHIVRRSRVSRDCSKRGLQACMGSLVGKYRLAQNCPPQMCLKLEVGLWSMAKETEMYQLGPYTKRTCLGFERSYIAEKLGYQLKIKY